MKNIFFPTLWATVYLGFVLSVLKLKFLFFICLAYTGIVVGAAHHHTIQMFNTFLVCFSVLINMRNSQKLDTLAKKI